MRRIENEWRYFDDELKINAPWYTLPTLMWLNTIEIKNKFVFEYGVGDSTYWYKVKGAQISGVDSNRNWAKKHHLWHCDNKIGYVSSIDKLAHDQYSLYDLVIIDGDYRDDCTQYALRNLKSGGHLIIDNFEQPSVPVDWNKTKQLIQGMNVQYFKEPGHADWQTIVITK